MPEMEDPEEALRRLLTGIAEIRSAWQAGESPRPALLGAEEARSALRVGRPLLSLPELPFDPAPASRLLAGLYEFAVGEPASPELRESFPSLLAGFWEEGENLSTALRHLAFEALRGEWELWAKPLRGFLDPDLARPNRCPVCGGPPVAAVLDHAEGRRYLQCGHCHTRWTYRRLGCPACGNDDEKSLGILLDEDHPEWRLDYCRKCGRYIKTADLARVSAADLATPSLAAWGLEGVAATEGLKPVTDLP